MTVECKINGAIQAYFTKSALPKQASFLQLLQGPASQT